MTANLRSNGARSQVTGEALDERSSCCVRSNENKIELCGSTISYVLSIPRAWFVLSRCGSLHAIVKLPDLRERYEANNRHRGATTWDSWRHKGLPVNGTAHVPLK